MYHLLLIAYIKNNIFLYVIKHINFIPYIFAVIDNCSYICGANQL